MLSRQRILTATMVAIVIAIAGACSKKSSAHPISDAGGGSDAAAKDSGTVSKDSGMVTKPIDSGSAMDDAGNPNDLRRGKHDIVYSGDGPSIDMRPDVKLTFDPMGGVIGYASSVDEAPELGTCQVSEIGGDDIVRVGRWNNGKMAGKYYTSSFSWKANEGFHYAAGVPTASIPKFGTTSYALLASSAPTIGGGAFKPGTVTGGVAIAWGATARVALDLTFKIPGDNSYHVITKGGLGNPSLSEMYVTGTSAPFRIGIDFSQATSITVASSGAACKDASGADAGGAPCNAIIYAWLLGPLADHLGMGVMVVGSGNAGHALHGALSFKKR